MRIEISSVVPGLPISRYQQQLQHGHRLGEGVFAVYFHQCQLLTNQYQITQQAMNYAIRLSRSCGWHLQLW